MFPIRAVPVVLASAFLVACSKPAPTEEPVRAVKLMKIETGALSATHEYAGDVRARTESRLGFRVGGQLVQRPAEVGQSVKAGQLLAVLDAQDYQSGLDAAQAQVRAAQTQRDLAAADLQRFNALRQQGFISSAELERRETALRAADAALDQAKAQASVQRNQAGYTRLLADADGVIVATEAEPGQVLAAGAPVVRLARNGPRDVVVSVSEDRVSSVRVGQAAQVRLWAERADSPRIAGTVREVAASADPVTRTYAVRVALPANVSVSLGATASVTLGASASAAVESARAIGVPTGALWKQAQGSAVWVFDPASNTVKAQAVTVAGVDGNQALIASGLKPGDEVVVAGVHVLTEGQKVTRYNGPAPR